MQTYKYILFSFMLLLTEHYYSRHPCDILLIEVFFFSNSKDSQNLDLLIAISRTICTSLVAGFVLSHYKREEKSYQKSSDRQKVKVSSVQDKQLNCSSTGGKKACIYNTFNFKELPFLQGFLNGTKAITV